MGWGNSNNNRSNTSSNGKPREESVGGAWENTSSKGNNYLSLNLKLDGKEFHLTAFHNDRKKNEKEPDWRIFVAKRRTQGVAAPAASTGVPAPAVTRTAAATPAATTAVRVDDQPPF